MNCHLKARFLLPLACAALMGCASAPQSKAEPAQHEYNDTDLLEALTESTTAMAQSLRVLYELRNSQAFAHMTDNERRQQFENLHRMPESLKVPVTVDHHGDAEMLIRRIARMIRYEVPDPVGRIPHDKPVVRINAEARPAIDILRDIGAQTDQRLNIDVLPAPEGQNGSRGTISLEYIR